MPKGDTQLPSVDALRAIVDLAKTIVFPGFFDRRQADDTVRSYHIGLNMERLYQTLREQIKLALPFRKKGTDGNSRDEARELAFGFIDRLPEIKRMLHTDVAAIFDDDPATDNYSEVIFCYPVVQAMIHYRIAHELLLAGIPVIPRIITELAHSATGIDIHPGAQIGEFFSIDHGTGVVIGETTVIGRNVKLYQGVTLGALSFPKDESTGMLMKGLKRHPNVEDNVVIYAGATILGGDTTIGHDSEIGGNVWLMDSIPPFSRVYNQTPFPRVKTREVVAK